MTCCFGSKVGFLCAKLLELLDFPVEFSKWAQSKSDSLPEKQGLDELPSSRVLSETVAFVRGVMPESGFDEVELRPNKALLEFGGEMESAVEKNQEKTTEEEEEEEEESVDGALRLERREKTKREASTPSPKPERTLLLR